MWTTPRRRQCKRSANHSDRSQSQTDAVQRVTGMILLAALAIVIAVVAGFALIVGLATGEWLAVAGAAFVLVLMFDDKLEAFIRPIVKGR
jgi:hypothetical protein